MKQIECLILDWTWSSLHIDGNIFWFIVLFFMCNSLCMLWRFEQMLLATQLKYWTSNSFIFITLILLSFYKTNYRDIYWRRREGGGGNGSDRTRFETTQIQYFYSNMPIFINNHIEIDKNFLLTCIVLFLFVCRS